MKHWTVGKRISFGFIAVLAITLCLGALSIYEATLVSSQFNGVKDVQVPALRYTLICRANVNEQVALVYKHIFSPSQADMTALAAHIDEDGKVIDTDLAALGKLVTSPEEESALAKVKDARNTYQARRSQILKDSAAATTAEASGKLAAEARAQLDPLAETYIDALTALANLEENNVNRAADTTAGALHRSNMGVGLGTLAAVLVGGVLALIIIRGITVALRLVAGNLDEASGQVTAAAKQVSGASQSLAEGASEQAASLEETGASLEEITSMTRSNAQSANQAKELSDATRRAADTGVADVTELKRAMDAITGSSAEISKIVKTIDEIAFQTNILALNAAVEAARAGDAGAGFAVVADEVRNLAVRCAESAKESTSKISESIANSEHGVKISAKVATTLNEIVEKARRVDSLIGEIATASGEQTEGIGQVNNAISQIDKVTQTNAGSAEETAAAAEELSAQAIAMRGFVENLRRVVDGSESSRATSAPTHADEAPAAPRRRESFPNGNSSKRLAPKKQPGALVGAANGAEKLDEFFQDS